VNSRCIHSLRWRGRAGSICGPWGFAYDDTDVGLDEQWHTRDDVYARIIEVPFPPESPASGIGDTSFHPVVWYRRTFDTATDDAGKRLILHCGAIDYAAMVWVNGQLLTTHQGGNTPFQVDITRALRADGPQVLVIRAEDNPGIWLNRAASRTGENSRTASGITGPPASGSQSGSSRWRPRI
jgi:beta-galactosidase/beta-glucuronidase